MIAVIIVIVAFLGVALVCLLASRVIAVDNEKSFKRHRSTQAGLADLLNYSAVVDDGIIVNKNGAFMAAWLYEAEDAASNTDTQQEALSAIINKAFLNLGTGWMIHVDAVRRPASEYSDPSLSRFPDAISYAMDEERRQLFESLGTLYEGYFIVTLTYYPPSLVQRKFVEMMFDDDTPKKTRSDHTQGLITKFKQDCLSFESRLSSAFQMTRLNAHKIENEDGRTVTHDDFLRWLQFCVTGRNHPIQLPSNPMYIDSLVGGQEMWAGVVPKIGRKFMQVVALDGFPLESSPGMLTALAELNCEYRWSSRFIFMDTHEAIAHMDKFRKKWRQKVRGFFDQVFNTGSGVIDQDALSMVEDAEEAIAEINSGLVSQGYYTSVVVLMDDDREQLDNNARLLEKAINRLGFNARIETINNMDAYLGSLPGHGVENVRRPLLNTLNLADMLPVSSIWTGEEQCPCPMYPNDAPALLHGVTQGSTPFRMNLHVRDLGHTFMFGPTGAGKSTHLALIAAQLRRYKNMCIFAFDKGMSMYPLAAGIRATTKGRGANHFSVASDDETLAFCPLQNLKTKSDRAWAMEWIDTILALNGLQTTAAQRNEIASALANMHASGAKTLSEFSVTIQDEHIRDTIRQYTIDGSMGHLLDAEQDGLSLTAFTVFEIEDLMNLGEKYALPVLLYLFRRVELALRGQPAAIILDEAWLMLGHPVFREKIREWLKVLRKANCLVLMATQSLSDAANSGIMDVLVESCATKIFLPNAHARDDDASQLYKRMGLNSRQIEILARAIPKREYYYQSEKGRRLYELALGPLTLAFVGASDKESIQLIKAMENRFGHDWVKYWLADRDIILEDYLRMEAAA